MPLKTTSIKVDQDIWKQVKVEAVKQDKQLHEILREALEEWLTKHQQQKEEKEE